jgi:hypothetical protein
VIGLMLMAAAATASPKPAAACTLTMQAKVANAKLSFDDFDQKGSTPTTARSLGQRGCWKAAAEATADYLIRGPIASPGEQVVLLFHVGQQLALGGEERRGADFVAAARRPVDPAASADRLRWNDYVVGTWAFLTKDRAMLTAARDAVLAGKNPGDQINGRILAALERCFNKPYIVAYDPKCGAPK